METNTPLVLEKQSSDTVVFLRGKKTVLRPLKDSDAPKLQQWINDPDIRPFVLNSFPIQLQGEIEFIERARKTDSNIILAIEYQDEMIGIMGLHRIDWISRIATTGAIIGPSTHRGQGLGTDAKIALLEYAFNTLGLRKIMSSVLDGNERSARYSQRCGYKIEARLKEQRFKNGRYVDEIILSVFKEDFEQAKLTLGY